MSGDAFSGISPLPPAPAALHAGGGRVAPFGRYAGAIADCDSRAWDGDGGLLSPRRLQRKTWMYFGAFSEPLMAGFAVVDAGLLSMAFAYVYDRSTGRRLEEKLQLPLGFGRDFQGRADRPWQLARGRRRWEILPQENGWKIVHESPRLRLQAEFATDRPALTAISGSLGRPFHSTTKWCALPVRLEVRIDGRELETLGLGNLDFSLGYPPRRTQWNWASLAGLTGSGQRFGLNAVAHFMNGLENGIWLGDALLPLAQTIFTYDPQQPLQPWRIHSVDGSIDLQFEPEGERRENVSAGVLASRFTQPYGRFRGQLRTAAGMETVSGYGVVEEHDAIW